ncbi:hypothetical protein MCEMSEM23_01931 [Rhabdaerophilaceae bacterium]
MATQKKNPDPSAAGVAAVENALGSGMDPAQSGSSRASTTDQGTGTPRLPRVDDVDVFSSEPVEAAQAEPRATLEIKPPQQRKARTERPDAAPEGDFNASRATASIAASALPVEAATVTPEPRRASILPANDDRRASVADLLEPLRRTPSRAPYLLAAVFAVLWIAAAWILLAKPDGLFLTSENTLRPAMELQLALAGIGILLPILFVFALAGMHRRSRELRNSARVMAEVAARLAEPEGVGADAVFTLGQAVRREVSSIGDGVERALSRATELESIVHGEVSALERSYADNEYKMRQLVNELSAEREAIMATAERIRSTIDAAHQGFAADIGYAGDSISRAIDEAGTRVTVLIGGKQDELVATLDRSASHAGEIIRGRTGELSEALAAATAETSAAMAATSGGLLSELSTSRIALVDELQRVTQETLASVGQASTTLADRLAEQTELSQREIIAASERAAESMRLSNQMLTAEWENATSNSTRQLAEMSEVATHSMRETNASLTSEWQSTTSEATRQLAQMSEATTQTIRETSAVLTSEWQSTTSEATRQLAQMSEATTQTIRETSAVLTSEWQSTTSEATRQLAEMSEAATQSMRETNASLTSEWQSTTSEATRQLAEMSEAATQSMRETNASLTSEWQSTTSQAARQLAETGARTADEIRATSASLTQEVETAASNAAKHLLETSEASARLVRETGNSLKSEVTETADIINSAFQQNSRDIIETIGSRAIEINETMRSASQDFISAMESRGLDTANLIEIKGTTVVNSLLQRSDELAERMIGAASQIEESLGTTSRSVTTVLSETARDLDGRLGQGTRELEMLLGANSQRLSDTFGANAQRLSDTFGANGLQIETNLARSISRIEQTLGANTQAIETALSTHREAFETTLASQGQALAEMIGARVIQANEAFGIASESLGSLISDRTREATIGLKSEIDDLGHSLLRQSTEATERLALAGRDVLQALNQHGVKVNEALAVNAQRLAETVSQRTAGLGESFAQFEKTFVDKADTLENALVVQSDVIGTRIADRTTAVASQIESLLSRIETGVDDRTRNLTDMVALRTLEFSRVISESGGSLLGNLEQRVKIFTDTVVLPLDQQSSLLEARTRSAAEQIEARTINAAEQIEARVRNAAEHVEARALDAAERIGRRLDASANQLEARSKEVSEQIGTRLDQSAGAIVLRAGEVERSLTNLSRDVGAELMGRADQISTLIDEKGASFVATFETRGRDMVESLEKASTAIASRVHLSLTELNQAIQSGSATSLNHLVDANEKLRGEVVILLDKLGDANRILNAVVGSTTHSLSEIEGRMGERVRGLEATLAAILSAANQGSDVLVSRVEAIRSASGDLLANSQDVASTLEARTRALRLLSDDMASNQLSLATTLADRQQAFEGLVNALNSRIEDVDAMLRSFTALVDDQLSTAQKRAREAAALVHDSAETAAQAIGSQYERIRMEAGKERERTSTALRSAYDQANTEMSGMFESGLQGFQATAAELRQATRDILSDLESTRAALQAGGLEIPREAREASANLKRVVSDQLRALSELQDIVSRSGPSLDVAEPRRAEPMETSRSLGLRSSVDPAPRQPTPRAPAPPQPAKPPARGNSWLSGMLERASDDEPVIGNRSAPRRIESLDSLSVDIARMIDHEAAIELWDRYRAGERNVFTRKLYTLQGQEAYDDIRRRYQRDAEFKRTVDAYTEQFERLLNEVAGDDRDSLVARTYLTSDTGKVYTMLAHAAGRFD